MRIVVQIRNSYALEEFVYTVKDTDGQEELRDIRLPADKFHLISDPVIVLIISAQGIIVKEDSSNVYFPITNKSQTHEGIIPAETEFKLFTQDKEELGLTVYQGEEAGMCFFQTERSRIISLGTRLDQTISCVDAPGISALHLMLKHAAGGYRMHVKGKEGCYLNKRYIAYMGSEPLSRGDIINIAGLRILWFEDHIGIERLSLGRPYIIRLDPVADIRQLMVSPRVRQKDFTPAPRNIIRPDETEIELDAPPKKQEMRSRPVFTTVGPALTMAVPMSLGCGLYIYSASNSGLMHSSMYMYTGLITALSSAVLGALWAYINIRQERKIVQRDEELRVRRYTAYIEDCNRQIRDKYRYNINAMLRNSPSLREIFGNENMIHIWNRRESDEALFSYRLGTGTSSFDVSLKIPKEGFSLTEDELANLPSVLKRRYSKLKDVPVCTDIQEEPLQCFLSENRMELEQLFLNIVLQITSTTGPELIRTVFMFTEGVIGTDVLRLMRWLPQAQGEDEHYVCTDGDRVDEMLCSLEALLRQPDPGKRRWILFTDDSRRIPASVYAGSNVSVLVFASGFASIPGNCTRVIQNDRSYRGILRLNGNDVRKELCFDRISLEEAETYVKKLSKIRLSSDKMHYPIPVKVTLAELFETDMITVDMICRNWSRNNTLNSLRAPVGMGEDRRIVFLDIHEKGYGPHGLVAGMTGSGKSEMLQTLILSLAVRYPPKEIGFFLIDYKGGGMASLFDGLPHLMGSISNLSGNMIHRAMVSIRSENERRQRLFLKAGVNSIRDYERMYMCGQTDEPLPHILIIIDEFAELKREEPDFMKELISVAQVGRSLGVHLILATQKPAGTVDDNIFSNSRFRICLRVQDKQDSNDMLHKPDAAYISNPGRAFLQVGSDELFEVFQAGYTMEPYDDSSGQVPVMFKLDEYGRGSAVFESKVAKDTGTEQETHFSMILKQLKMCTLTSDQPRIPGLWLPVLKSRIVLNDSIKDKKRDKYDIILGRYDEPAGQRQEDLHHSLTDSGHTVICGSTLSGKSTFLQTFIYSHIISEVPDDINIYIVDYSNGMLSCFKDSKAVGAYITEENSKRLGNLFCMLDEIMNMRRTGWDGVSFIQKLNESGFHEPAVLLVIDNYGSFREKTAGSYDKDMMELIRFGETYGMYVLMTGASIGSNDIPSRLFENCRTGICLRMNDKYQYSECLREIRIPISPDDIKGRGLAHIDGHILEFQTALCFDGNDYERSKAVKKRIDEINASYAGMRAQQVPYIPESPVVSDLDHVLQDHFRGAACIPLGYEAVSGKPFVLNEDGPSCLIIAGREGSGKSNACGVIEYFAGRFGRKVLHAAGIEEICISSVENKDHLIVCDGAVSAIEEFYRNYDEHTEAAFIELVREKGRLRLVVTMDASDHTRVAGRRIYEELRRRCIGIYMAGGLDRQSIFDFSYLSYSEQCLLKPQGTGTVLKRGVGSYHGDIIIPCADAVI